MIRPELTYVLRWFKGCSMHDSFRADPVWLTGRYKKFGTDRSCQSMKRRRELNIFFSYSILAEAGGGVGWGWGSSI